MIRLVEPERVSSDLSPQITLAFKDVVNITREKTARWIPNAVQVCTAAEKVNSWRSHTFESVCRKINTSPSLLLQFFFTSFSARKKTYEGVFRMWQNNLLDKVRPGFPLAFASHDSLLQTRFLTGASP